MKYHFKAAFLFFLLCMPMITVTCTVDSNTILANTPAKTSEVTKPSNQITENVRGQGIDTATAQKNSMDSTKAVNESQTLHSSTVSETSTPTPIPSTTPTPLPTLYWLGEHPLVREEEATRNLKELLMENSGCSLPCWWGIIPGETQISEISEKFNSKGFWWLSEFNELHDSSDAYSVTVFFEEKDGVIQSIKVKDHTIREDWDLNKSWENYSVSEIVRQYGKPDKVVVYHPYRFDRAAPPVYHLLLFYETLGFEIDYYGSVEYGEDPSKVLACPNIMETDVLNLFLYQPQNISNPLEHVLPEDDIGFNSQNGSVYDDISWEGATGLTLDDFYNLFAGSNSQEPPCFEFNTYWLSSLEE